MRKVLFLLFLLGLWTGGGYLPAQEGKEPKTILLKGIILDNQCATAHHDDLASFIDLHPRDCGYLKSAYAAGGFSLFVNGNLLKFDDQSNLKVEKFLQESGSDLKVVVEVTAPVIDKLHLVSIRNQ